jgi:hypothetical protein
VRSKRTRREREGIRSDHLVGDVGGKLELDGEVGSLRHLEELQRPVEPSAAADL